MLAPDSGPSGGSGGQKAVATDRDNDCKIGLRLVSIQSPEGI
jgi:hypothetical protein